MQRPKAADMVWRTLEAEGVRVVFGHPGGAILPIYDALYRHGGIRHVLTRHEQGAAHAADGYARVTGRPGVCLATSGPGATNLITGLATARMDSVPLLAITGQVPLDVMGTQAFQETDIVSVARPVTKAAWLVEDPDRIAEVLCEALRLARSGRPGPVLVDVPKCVQKALSGPPPARRGRGSRRDDRGCPGGPEDNEGTWEALDRVAALLEAAERPVLMVGRGVLLSGTTAGVAELAERLDLPVVTTLLGLDAFPSRDPRALGMPGMHGSERANRAIDGSDLVLGLGLRFDDRVVGDPARFAPEASVVHFDVDPGAPGRTVEADVAVVGDLEDTLPALLSRVTRRRVPGWWERIRAWSRESAPDRAPAPDPERSASPGEACTGGARTGESGGAEHLSGRAAARALCRKIEVGGGILVTDVGQHQMWMAQELRGAEPGTHLTSGGLGTMGYALPAAMGAALGSRSGFPAGPSRRPVWMVAGDGGFQMTLQELATVREEGLAIRMAVMNNGFLGMVRQWQELFYDRRYAATRLVGPDFVELARAYGIPARSAATASELEDALDWAESVAGPVLLDVRVRPEENVYPMVPTGASLGEMVPGPPTRSLPGVPGCPRVWCEDPGLAKMKGPSTGRALAKETASGDDSPEDG